MLSPEVEALAGQLEAVFANPGSPDAAAAADDAAFIALIERAFPSLAAAAQQRRQAGGQHHHSSGGGAGAMGSDGGGGAGAEEGGGDGVPAAAAATATASTDRAAAVDRVRAAHATRAAFQRLVRRALADGAASPMRWAAPGAGAQAPPALPQFLERVAAAAARRCLDQPPTAAVMALLEEVADAAGSDGCGDVLEWLRAGEQTYRGARDAAVPLLKLCNRLLSRLPRASEPGLRAGVAVFLARVLPLNERSGLNLAGNTAPPLVPAPEPVPAGAVDSSGQPVDALLYATVWGLQAPLHSPRDAAAPDAWSKFVADARTVLAALAAQPAQVAAGGARAVANSTGNGNGGGAAAATTPGYLAAPQLFGLQLRDATFRRDLLVQLLVALGAARAPIKPADPCLRGKQLVEAGALEADAYAALAATPADGPAFAAAVRATLERERAWAQWKRGGPPPVPLPEAKGGACPDFERAPLAPALPERIADAAAKERAAGAARRAKRDVALKVLARERRSTLEMDTDEVMAPRRRARLDPEALKGASHVDRWVHRVPDNNLAGLKAAERAAFPTLELLARPALEQMDPDSCCDPPDRLVAQDPVYRWRLARLMARRWPGSAAAAPLPPFVPPRVKERLTSAAPDEVELVLARTLPDLVPEAWREASAAAVAKEAAAEAAAAAAKAAAAAAPKEEAAGAKSGAAGGGAGSAATAGADSAATGAAAGGEDGAAAAAVKSEPANGGGGGGGGADEGTGGKAAAEAEAPAPAAAAAEAAAAAPDASVAGDAAAGGGDAAMADAADGAAAADVDRGYDEPASPAAAKPAAPAKAASDDGAEALEGLEEGEL